MIGSPDVLAFTSEGDLGGYPDAQVLPEEFSLPLLPLSHPWTSPAHFNRDFILVAEFSEQVGPGRGWCVCFQIIVYLSLAQNTTGVKPIVQKRFWVSKRGVGGWRDTDRYDQHTVAAL